MLPFRPGDFPAGVEPDGSWYRVKVDANGVEYYCKVEFIRPVAGATNANKRKAEEPTGEPREGREEQGAEDEGETASDVRPTLECPVEQNPAGKGARPNAELFKKIIRCKKGEKSAENSEGTVTVDVSALQIGSPRPWSYSQDIGNAKPGTTVYPVKATYTVKTHYGTATEVEENWIRIFNFYVNAFGEWQIGSEENVKSPAVKRIPKNR